jgi:shikimate dehydrogenase
MTISGKTLVAGVVGNPITHSMSPVLHNAWLAAAGIDGVYIPLQVDELGFANFVNGLRASSLSGLNVTVPFKELALRLAHEAHPRARRAQAANVLVFDEYGTIWADNTDGLGLIAAFAEQAPSFDPASGPVVILGAGGGARGAVGAFLDAGCRDIRIVNRSLARAEALAADLGVHAFEIGDAAAVFHDAAAVINATSAGLAGAVIDVPLGATPEGCVVMDMTYKPLITPFLAEARRLGRPTVDGLAMLIGQAIPSFEAFFGQPPPAEVEVRALVLQTLGL